MGKNVDDLNKKGAEKQPDVAEWEIAFFEYCRQVSNRVGMNVNLMPDIYFRKREEFFADWITTHKNNVR